MELILADYSASISELKKSPTRLLKEANGSAIAILNHNRPTAYLVPAQVYERLLEIVEDYELGQIVKERESEKSQAVGVSLDEL